ncbi:MAG: hypothetical protein Ta2E_12420 [Mycoplasmoidaceae bacterium]|nr:MAG: hypothetical protein Ta2E_12420 [Mycoplasmoidaceae bacterium]
MYSIMNSSKILIKDFYKISYRKIFFSSIPILNPLNCRPHWVIFNFNIFGFRYPHSPFISHFPILIFGRFPNMFFPLQHSISISGAYNKITSVFDISLKYLSTFFSDLITLSISFLLYILIHFLEFESHVFLGWFSICYNFDRIFSWLKAIMASLHSWNMKPIEPLSNWLFFAFPIFSNIIYHLYFKSYFQFFLTCKF